MIHAIIIHWDSDLEQMSKNRSILTSELARNYNRMQDLSDSNSISHITNGFKCMRTVQFLSLGVFRQQVVNHFSILFSQNKIEWTVRKRKRMMMIT
jgi:hypothetical protein